MPLSILATVAILLVTSILYVRLYRPWQLHWGAQEDEIKRAMPGDEIVPNPSFNATRGVTIRASAESIYPWIVQMGMNRAGWYSYDVLDNLGRKSAEEILPQFQQIKAGDLIPMSPDGKQGIWVKEFQASQWMLWWDKKGDTSWAWGIYPESDGSCRLITRVRTKYHWFSIMALFNLLIEFADLPMMRKCMLGIKRRAEAMPHRQLTTSVVP